jgi:hypothetical protein
VGLLINSCLKELTSRIYVVCVALIDVRVFTAVKPSKKKLFLNFLTLKMQGAIQL